MLGFGLFLTLDRSAECLGVEGNLVSNEPGISVASGATRLTFILAAGLTTPRLYGEPESRRRNGRARGRVCGRRPGDGR